MISIEKFAVSDQFLAPSGQGGGIDWLVKKLVGKIGDLESLRDRYGVIMSFDGFAEGGFGDGFKRIELANAKEEVGLGCSVKDMSDKLSMGGIADDVESFGVKGEVVV